MKTQTLSHRTESPAPQRASTRPSHTYTPLVDIIEKPNEWLLVADLPGTTADNIDIDFDRGTLTLRGFVPARNGPQEGSFLHCEYGVGDFFRSFEVGEGIDSGKIEAEFRDGVLTLHLPKAEAAKARKIVVGNK